MKKKDQVSYLNHWMGVMLKELTAFKQTAHPEALHQFRVAKKRIQAWLEFITAQGNTQAACIRWRPFKNIYRDTGKIRSRQLLQLYVKDAHLAWPKKDWSPLQEMIKSFNQDYRQHRQIIRFYQRLIQVVPTSLDRKAIILYLEEKFKHVAELLQHPEDQNNLHPARIEIKRLLYLQEIPGAQWPKHKFFVPGKLEELQKDLGEWHDRLNYLQLLKEEFPEQKEALAYAEQDEQKLQKKLIVTLEKLNKNKGTKPAGHPKKENKKQAHKAPADPL